MSYPLAFPDADPRFTGALLDDIASVLVSHGYPAAFEDDTVFAGLRATMTGFLYGPAFNRDDQVTWSSNGCVWAGKVEYVTNTDDGPVARIHRFPQPGLAISATTVVPCRELTLVSGGAR